MEVPETRHKSNDFGKKGGAKWAAGAVAVGIAGTKKRRRKLSRNRCARLAETTDAWLDRIFFMVLVGLRR
jgi:hypothetical protein